MAESSKEERDELLERGVPSSEAAATASTSVSDSASSKAAGDGHVALDADYFRRVAPPLIVWLLFSVGQILFNKYLYTGPFKHPLTLTAVHMTFMTLCTQVMARTGHLTLPALGWDFYLRAIAPLALMFAASLAFSNLAQMILTVSFIQMVKAVTPLMTLAVCIAFGTERFHWSLLFITTLMTCGVGVASLGELEFNALGLLLQLSALTVESVRLVAIQRVVQKHLPKPTNPLLILALFAPLCAALLVPAALWLERGAWAQLSSPASGIPVFFNSLSALGLNFSVVWLVSQESGPLTLSASGRGGCWGGGWWGWGWAVGVGLYTLRHASPARCPLAPRTAPLTPHFPTPRSTCWHRQRRGPHRVLNFYFWQPCDPASSRRVCVWGSTRCAAPSGSRSTLCLSCSR